MHACNVGYMFEAINFPVIMTGKLNVHIKLKYSLYFVYLNFDS